VDSFTLQKIEFDAVRAILAEFCACSLGKGLAAALKPSRKIDEIHVALEQVNQMVRAAHDVGLPPFGGVADIAEPLDRAHPSSGATAEDYAAIAAALVGAGNVRQYLLALPEALDGLIALADGIGDFTPEVEAIRAVVDADGTIRDDASPRLSEIRRDVARTGAAIHDQIYGYLRQPEVARLLQNATVTLHGDRYVLPVKADNRGRLPGVVHRVSHSGATVFVEPSSVVEMNNRLVDLYDDERREVQRLLNELAMKVQKRHRAITRTLRTLGQVDLLSAKAQYAYQMDMTCPEVVERGPVQLSQVRHPLLIDQAWRQEQAGVPAGERHAVVPIDVRLGVDFDLLVITGSNTGGKTVTLKTVALLAMMAQSGMHIPARRGAKLPVFGDVFIDVGDEQSLQQSLSTFGAHIKRLKHILRRADRTSLVLLDELGAGTDPDEGGAIGQAVLDELRRIGCLGMVTTHLSVLKAYAMNHDRVDNASVEFNTRTLSPTYHLRIGTPGESHAITVADRLGMPGPVIAAARKRLNKQGRQFRKAIRATGAVRQQAEAARADAEAAQADAEVRQEQYSDKLSDVQKLQREFQTWLASLGQMRQGDPVAVPALGKTGRLVRLELHRQLALAECDGVQVEVPLRDLMPSLGQSAAREEVDSMRRQLAEQVERTAAAEAEAKKLEAETRKIADLQKQRARQFDTWLAAIGRVRVGSEVTIARRPGKGKVLQVNLLGLRATIETSEGKLEVPLQDLFPQSGPFARREPRRQPQRRGAGQGAGRRGQRGPAPDKPMRRSVLTGKAADENRQAVLKTPPGEQVFVIPFQKRATLVRILPEKEKAVVQSGAFEMEFPLSDLAPVRPAS